MSKMQRVRMFRNHEGGQSVLLLAAVLPVLMTLLALVADVGGAAFTYHDAQIATDAAAFAAAQGIDVARFYERNEVKLDPDVAPALAGQYASLNSRGVLDIVSVFSDGDQVWVVGRMTYHTLFAHFLGVPTITSTIYSSAVPAFGIEFRDQ